jgi:AraC-like DNA-binding protein
MMAGVAISADEAEARTPAAHKGGVHILAEPTTGPHPAAEQLLGLLDRLVDSGKPVIAIEHLAAYLGRLPRCSRTSMKRSSLMCHPSWGRARTAAHLSDLARLRRVRDRIDREYAQPLNVEALARGVNMSGGHLSRQFRLAYGESPYGYLMTRRIERAMALLRRGDLSVTEICFAVGCSSLGTFSTRFTELVGMSPSAYRRRAAGAAAGMPPCVAKRVTRPIRNQEAPVAEPELA